MSVNLKSSANPSGFWTPIPEAFFGSALADPRLTHAAKCLLITLLRLAIPRFKQSIDPTATLEELAKMCGMSTKTVTRAIESLVIAGYMPKPERRGAVYRFHLFLAEGEQPVAETSSPFRASPSLANSGTIPDSSQVKPVGNPARPSPPSKSALSAEPARPNRAQRRAQQRAKW